MFHLVSAMKRSYTLKFSDRMSHTETISRIVIRWNSKWLAAGYRNLTQEKDQPLTEQVVCPLVGWVAIKKLLRAPGSLFSIIFQ
jgi:hypothetical protein